MNGLMALTLSAFVLTSNVDPITDKQSHILALYAEDFALAFKCDKPGIGSIYAVYTSNKYLGGGRNPKRPLIIRFGSETPFEGWWQYDRNSAYAFGDANIATMMDEAFVSKKVTIRATKYDLTTITNTEEYQADIADANNLIRRCDPGLIRRVRANQKK